MDWSRQGKRVLDQISSLRDVDRDDLLERLGLQERRSTFGIVASSFGIFCLGALIGVGFGIAFAPKPGADLRNELSDRLRRRAEELPRSSQGGYPNVSSRGGHVPLT
jgi:hypothetical protein